jgi:hypothetical protein
MIKAELFTPVLAWLDAGAPETSKNLGFNMEVFCVPFHPDFSGHLCGTVMCIAGATYEFNNLPKGAINALGERIGMNKEQIENLFYARCHDTEPSGTLLDWEFNDTTPAQAARAIRSMLETGEVVWS